MFRELFQSGIVRRLLFKLMMVTAALICSISVIAALYTYFSEKKALQSEIVDIQRSYLAVLSKAVWVDDKESLDLALLGISHLPCIAYAGVTSKGKVISEAGVKPTNNFNSHSVPINFNYNDDTYHLGRLQLEGSREYVLHQVKDAIVVSITTQFFVVLSVCLVIAFITYRTVIFRLLNITWYTSTLTQGSLERELPVLLAGNSRDELDDLANSINTMRINLLKAFEKKEAVEEKLRRHQKNLEDQVAERTASLEKINSRLQEEIEDRKLLEQQKNQLINELHAANATLNTAMNCSPAGIAIADAPSGMLRYVNQAGLGIRGAAGDKAVMNIGPDEYVESWQVFNSDGTPCEEDETPLVRAIKYGETCNKQLIIRRDDGEDRVVWAHAAPVRDDQGEVIAGIVVFPDITELKEKEQALRESESRYRLTFEAIPDSITITRLKDGRYSFVNNGYCDLTGYSREEVIGKTPLDINLYANPEDRLRMMEKLRQTGLLLNYEVQFRKKDGEIWDSYFSARPVEINGEDCLIALAKDVTEFKNAESEKNRLEEQLRQAQKMEAIGTLAGGIAHDFNNILTAIIGFSELALEKAEVGQPSPEELSRILSSAQRAKDLVIQILTFSRKVESTPKPIKLNDLVCQTEQMLERTIPRMVEIEHHLDEDIRPISADPSQITQVLMNLCANASDAMIEGGKLTIKTENVTLDEAYSNRHSEIPPGEYVLLTVTDTGHGMDHKTMTHIFEPFFTQKEVGKGTGLGLSMVYGIVKNHDGHVVCRSELGQGTTFEVYFRALRETTVGKGEVRPAGREASGGTEKILLVDDEETLRDLGSRILSRQGYRVCTAQNGEEALAMYGESGGDIDLVILDLNMPGMGGRKCLQEMLKLDPDIKVIISSGYSWSGQPTDDMDQGAAGFMPKPFSKSDMLTITRQVLDK